MQRNTLSRIAVVAIVAAALAFLWGAGLGWFVSTVLQPNYSTRYEEIVVAADGTPFIRSNSPRDWQNMEYLTLDRKLLGGKLFNELQSARFNAPPKPPGLWNVTMDWSQRIEGFYNSASPPSRWYFIIDDQSRGSAYFVVYDALSRLPIGYVGRTGLRSAIPAAAECFQIGGVFGTFRIDHPVVSSASTGGSAAYPTDYGSSLGSEIPNWLLFVKDGDSVREIDMRTRDMRVFYELPNLSAFSSLSEGVAGGQSAPTDATSAKVGAETPPSAEMLRAYGDYKQRFLLALRSEKQIAVVDPTSGASQIFELPGRVREGDLTVYSIGNGQLLLQIEGGWVRTMRTIELIWIDTAGKELRSESLELGGYVPESPRESAWTASVIAPIPLGWFFVTGGFAAALQVQNHRAPNYAAALQQVFDEVWPPALAVLLVGAICAAMALRWHRQYSRPDTWAWALTVFLLGPASLLAYWLHWCRPPRQRCELCGALVPREREACAACGTEFFPPTLRGTEVFA